jgi:hypothetical protein
MALTRAATIRPYIPWDVLMLTERCTKYCNRETGSLRWTVAIPSCPLTHTLCQLLYFQKRKFVQILNWK